MEPAGTNNARGIVLMIVAMAGFAIADTLIKSAAGRISPAQVMFLLMGGGLLVFASIALLKGQRLLDARAFAPMMVLRYLSEIISVGGMVLALSFVPLSTVGAILQATPLLVAVGAVLFLGEKVSWRRWSAIILGFFGVLLIIGPGGEEFDAAILWAVASMVCLSIRDLTTRLVPPDIPSASLASFTMIAAMPFAISWVLFNGESLFPAQANWFTVVGMVGFGSFGYLLLIASIRMSDISIVSPFRYTRLIFLLVTGVVVFDEKPSVSMLLGAGLVIISGVYMMWRERQVASEAKNAAVD